MKAKLWEKFCVYTSAGTGPVSLGLVTVLALLLTCRGQRKGDMTDTRAHLRHRNRALKLTDTQARTQPA